MAGSIIPSSIVEINEIENGTKFYRNFAFPELHLDEVDDDGYVQLVLPFDFWFLSIEFYAGPGSGAVLGDRISALVSPFVPIDLALQSMGAPPGWGLVTADVTTGDQWISVRQEVLQDKDRRDGFLRIGSHLYLGDPNGTEYTIVDHDLDNNKIQIATLDFATRVYTLGAAEDHTLGTSMYRTIVAGDRIGVLPTYDGNVYGASKIGSSKLPANTPFRVHYYRKSGSAGTRDITINIEGMIGKD